MFLVDYVFLGNGLCQAQATETGAAVQAPYYWRVLESEDACEVECSASDICIGYSYSSGNQRCINWVNIDGTSLFLTFFVKLA